MQCEINVITAATCGRTAERCPEDGKSRPGISTVMCDGHYAMWKDGKRMDIVEGRRKTRQPGVCVTDGRITVSGWANDFIRAYSAERNIPVKRLVSAILEGWAMRVLTKGADTYLPEIKPSTGAGDPE